MSQNQFNILNRFFSRSILLDLFKNGNNHIYHTCVDKFLSNEKPLLKTNREIIKSLYLQCNDNYRNEYFYKNTIINKLLLEKYNLTTTVALNEIAIGQSIADLILINGQAIIYEIKSDIDNNERLISQISSYFKAIDTVYIVTYEENAKKIKNQIDNNNIGIYILSKKGELIQEKAATPNRSELHNETIMKLLHKNEYQNIITQIYGQLPKTSPIMFYRECSELFNKIDTDIVYKLAIDELKERNIRHKKEYKKIVPYELKFPMYFSNLRISEFNTVNAFLNTCYRGG